MDFEVIVQAKKEVLDPEGRAIQQALSRVGFSALQEVRVAKRYVLTLDPSQCPDPTSEVAKIAREHLANPVAETFEVKRI